MFIEACILGIFIGLIRGGRLNYLQRINITGWFLIILLYLIQVTPLFLSNIEVIKNYGYMISFVSMVMMFVIIVINIKLKGFVLIAMGSLMNLVAMGLSGFKMPINLSSSGSTTVANMISGISSGEILNYINIADSGNITKFLGKIIVLPDFYPLVKFLSIGDIFMSFGIIMLIQYEMNNHHNYYRRNTGLVQFPIGTKMKR